MMVPRGNRIHENVLHESIYCILCFMVETRNGERDRGRGRMKCPLPPTQIFSPLSEKKTKRFITIKILFSRDMKIRKKIHNVFFIRY
jgi:hypothetical protein